MLTIRVNLFVEQKDLILLRKNCFTWNQEQLFSIALGEFELLCKMPQKTYLQIPNVVPPGGIQVYM